MKIDRKIIYKVLSQSFRVSRPVPLFHAFRVLPYRKCVLPEVCCRLSHNRKKESNRFRYVLVGISSGGHIRISAYTPIYVSFERISLMVIKYSIVVYVENESNEKQNPHLKRIRRNPYFPSCENWGGKKGRVKIILLCNLLHSASQPFYIYRFRIFDPINKRFHLTAHERSGWNTDENEDDEIGKISVSRVHDTDDRD